MISTAAARTDARVPMFATPSAPTRAVIRLGWVAALLAVAVAVLSPLGAAPASAATSAYAYETATSTYDSGVSLSHRTSMRPSPAAVPSGPAREGSGSAATTLFTLEDFAVAAKSVPEDTTILYRAVGQNEADDIAAVGGYRNAPGLEGKYFFRSRQQAEQYGQMMNKAPGFGAPNYLTSGSIPTRLLGSAEGMEAGSEGPGLFFRNDPSSFFNVFNHGLIP